MKPYERTLTMQEVLLHWAISECLSPRWQQRYSSAVTGDERVILRRSDDARLLPESLQSRLLAVLKHDRGGLIDTYITPSNRFALVGTPLAALGDVPIMREMGIDPLVTLKQYKDMPAIENYALDPHHSVTPLLATDLSKWRGYPILGFDSALNDYVLIDGFARALALYTLFVQGKISGTARMIYADTHYQKDTGALVKMAGPDSE